MLKAFSKKMVLPTLVMIWATTYFLECQNYKLKSRRLVSIVFFMMLGLYVINALTDYFEVRKAWRKQPACDRPASPKGNLKEFLLSSGIGRMVAIFAVLILYVLCLDRAGFILTTLICSCLIMLVMGERKWYILVFMPIALVVLLYVIFNFGLRVPLPKGFLTIL